MYNMKYVGKEYKTYQGYKAKVIDGSDASDFCTIEIEGRQWEVRTGALKKGNVKNPWHPSVYGVGYLGTIEKGVTTNNKEVYSRWSGMLARCYSHKYHAKNPTFKECTVVKEWHSFYNFLQWYKDNVRLDENGVKYQLDKDLLVEGNKIHGPEFCIFIPAQVNTFMANIHRNNKSGYTGVSYHKASDRYNACTNIFKLDGSGPTRKFIGAYKTAKEASNVYKMARNHEANKVKKWMKELGYKQEVYDNIK